jgi:RNA polymerase sigma-70 factor, ECF subfamily
MFDAAVMSGVSGTADISFEQVVRDRETLVLRTAYRILGNWADAEEVAQEAFVRLHRNGLGFANAAVLNSWLYRVTVNLCMDRHRSARRYEELTEAPSPLRSAEADAIRDQQKQQLMQALAALPPKERAAVVLREIEGLSTAEVASVLGSTEGTVRSQVFKALGHLRKLMQKGAL